MPLSAAFGVMLVSVQPRSAPVWGNPNVTKAELNRIVLGGTLGELAVKLPTEFLASKVTGIAEPERRLVTKFPFPSFRATTELIEKLVKL